MIKLLKVIVRPVYVDEDEDGLFGNEQSPEQPFVVSARDWPAFPEHMANLEVFPDPAAADSPMTGSPENEQFPGRDSAEPPVEPEETDPQEHMLLKEDESA